MATPVEWLNEFQVNTGAADVGGISDTQTIGLANGNYLVTWTENGTAGIGTTAGTDIIGVIFDAEGAVVEGAQRLNSNRNSDDERDYDVAATNDGGFIMVYVDDDISNSAQEAIIWERFDDTGDAIDNLQIASNTVAADVLSNPTVVVNNNDNSSFVTFTDDVGADTDIRAVRVNASGTIIATEFDAAQNSSDFDGNGDTAINFNGELVSIYQEDDAGTFGIELRVYNTAGVLQHFTTVEATASSDPHVATLTNGNIVATWVDGINVQYRVYDSDLVPVAGPFNVDGSPDTQNEPEIVALPDGGFVIVWDNDTDNTLEARRFNDTGSVAASDSVFVIEPPAGAEITPDVGVTGDGRLLFTWEEGDNVFSSIWDTRGTIIDTVDYATLPLNFINDGNFITANTISSTVNGDGGGETILGQGGNDFLFGDGGIDTIEGGGGNDTIEGGFGQDEIDGGSGADTFIIRNGEFGDNIVGGGGADTLDVSNRSDFALTIDLEAGTYTSQNAGNTISSVETVIGSQLGDTITSTFGTQTLEGEGGDDTFIHGNGQFIDDIDGGGGTDTLDLTDVDNPGEGVNINLGADIWTGLGGTQSIEGIEIVKGTQENDTFRGENGTTFAGGDGDDTIIFGSGDGLPDYFGDGGVDTADFSLFGSADFYIDLAGGGYRFNATTPGTFSGDLVDFENYRGGAASDVVKGNSSDNVIDGNQGADELRGEGGNDTLRGENGADELRGGSGNDDIFGGSGADRVFDGTGNDTVGLGQGNDFVRVGDGMDSFNGGAGTDYISYFDSPDGVILDLGANTASGGWADDDTVLNFEGATGSATGDDIITGTAGVNIIETADGNDMIFGANGNDDLGAGRGRDEVFGGNGRDDISGGKGDDELYGGKGGDRIEGGNGDDFLTGGAGQDDLVGGIGKDIFHFDRNKGSDVIEDFENNIDTIEFDNFGYLSTPTDALSFASQTGSDVLFDFGSDGTLLVENVTMAQLSNDIDIV